MLPHTHHISSQTSQAQTACPPTSRGIAKVCMRTLTVMECFAESLACVCERLMCVCEHTSRPPRACAHSTCTGQGKAGHLQQKGRKRACVYTLEIAATSYQQIAATRHKRATTTQKRGSNATRERQRHKRTGDSGSGR